MNAIPKKFQTLIATGFLAGLSSMTLGQTTIFGSDNNGFGDFTNSAENGTEAWTNTAGSVNYAFGTTPSTGTATHDEGNVASLLKSYTLDKNPGSEYSIEGVLDLTNGYGDDNNRIGILLFNTADTQTADGGGGLYLRVNTDDGNSIDIRNGINGSLLGTGQNHSYNPGDQWIGQTLTFSADLTFRNDGIDDVFDVSFVLTDSNSNTYNASASDLVTSTYNGTHFGFASKWRYRDQSSSDRDVPAEFDYQSFSVNQTAIPEPSTLALLGVALGAMVFFRRRK